MSKQNGKVMGNRQIQLKSRPQGMPTRDNFDLVEVPTPDPAEGEILVRNRWLSVDPYMRGRMNEGDSYVPAFELGEPMEGGCVGEVVESRNGQFSKGDWVLGQKGWRDYWTSDGTDVAPVDPQLAPPQAYLGAMGLTGMTAYVGLLKIGQLKDGERVFVSAASGAVGSIACQIAKAKNCFVIGSSGSEKKIHWLREKAGVDAAFDYHESQNLSASLENLLPGGLDVYFDNVGGDHLQAAIDNMSYFGRIVCCGMISGYNDAEPQPGPNNLFKIIAKRLKLQGFIVRDHMELREEFQKQMAEWTSSGKVVWEETVTDGLENAPQAFLDLFAGEKLGKSLVHMV